MNVTEKLFEKQDLKYKDFNCSLLPGVDREAVIGVRAPDLKIIGKEIIKEGSADKFISVLPHEYFEENNIHAFIISQISDYDRAVTELDRFLPFVDNWATCDGISPKAFKKNRDRLKSEIERWISSGRTYTVRFGVKMCMDNYLDEDFDPVFLEKCSLIKSDEYYINMMIAWYFATALAKKRDAALPYIEDHKLPEWTHNKAIQKAVESSRITDKQKELLKKYRTTSKRK